jgi:hypothetical protein
MDLTLTALSVATKLKEYIPTFFQVHKPEFKLWAAKGRPTPNVLRTQEHEAKLPCVRDLDG